MDNGKYDVADNVNGMIDSGNDDGKIYYPPTASEVEKGLEINPEYPYGHPKRTGDIGNVTRYK